MCASCGCGMPHENHGDAANITLDDIERAAESAGITAGQVAENIRTSV